MHVSLAKHSYVWLSRKCDYRTDRHTHAHTDTDAGQSDPYVPLCFAGDTKMKQKPGMHMRFRCYFCNTCAKVDIQTVSWWLHLIPHSRHCFSFTLILISYIFLIQRYIFVQLSYSLDRALLTKYELNWFKSCIIGILPYLLHVAIFFYNELYSFN